MVNFRKQKLPFYWVSSGTLLPAPAPRLRPPPPSTPLFALSPPPPHFTAAPNATIGIPNRPGTIQHHCSIDLPLLVPVNAESFHAPALPLPSPLRRFFATLEKDDRLAHVRCHVCSRKRNFRAAFASNPPVVALNSQQPGEGGNVWTDRSKRPI